MKAIVFTSNTGSTAEYARILEQKTGIKAYDLKTAEKTLAQGDEIVYLGWLMAGLINGYNRARRLFDVKAVGAVGISAKGVLRDEIVKNNNIPSSVELFELQGAYYPQKLRGLHKLLMKIVAKSIVKSLRGKALPTDEDLEMINVLENGGSFISEQRAEAFADYIVRAQVANYEE